MIGSRRSNQQIMARIPSVQKQSDIEPPTAPQRALVPREHGAYVELGFPLITALALGGFGVAQLLLAVAAIAVFLAHEPILVLAGGRGTRALGRLKRRALRLAAIWLVVALTAGAMGLSNAPPAAWASVMLPLVLAALLVPLIFSHCEKTLAGELLVAATFSSALIPIAMAGGVASMNAATAGSTWAAIFWLETLTVRAVRASLQERINPEGSFRAIVIVGFVATLAAGLLALSRVVPPLVAIAIVPAALVALTVGWVGLHPRRLRALGWSFAASNLIALTALLSALS
jgi:hypothetical protein